MSLSDRDLRLVGAVLPSNTSLTNFTDFRCSHGDLSALLDAARAEGRPSPDEGEDRRQAHAAEPGPEDPCRAALRHAEQSLVSLKVALGLPPPSPERAEGAAAGEAWRPISELVETVQEGFMLVWPTTAGSPEVWANQTYFEALRRGAVPGWAHLFEDAKAVTHFQPVPLPSEDHLKSDGAALSQPSQDIETLKREAYQQGWNDREADLIAGAERVLGPSQAGKEASLVERLEDPNFEGAFQHLRSHDDIDGLFKEAATRIRALEAQASTYSEAWDWFSSQRNLDMSFRYDWPDEGDTGAWQVHRVSGGRSDREWELVGFGQTPLEAVTAARHALSSSHGGGNG